MVDVTNSVFTGQNPDVQTKLQPYTYGDKYFDRFRKFPYMENMGYELIKTVDNLKSWDGDNLGLRKNQGDMNAYYQVSNEQIST